MFCTPSIIPEELYNRGIEKRVSLTFSLVNGYIYIERKRTSWVNRPKIGRLHVKLLAHNAEFT